MRRQSLAAVLMTLAALLVPAAAGHAQEAALGGTVADATGGVLPGVTVTAVHEATGNVFTAVTDGTGAYRIPARAGAYRVTAELSGFTTVTRTGVELLVGQLVAVNFQMTISTVQESVTVTGEAPLVDTTTSSLAGNIDPRQMQDLPVLGRNWIDLVTLAPGSRANAVSEQGEPVAGTSRRDFQINLDGQQVTSNLTPTASQPRISRDAIAEFQFVSSRFDATQGRSSGVQVNAITKSGTNTFAGSLSGYFRHDSLNAADPIARSVLPYSQQQVSSTYGGPIVRDRFHFFGYYEYDRNPATVGFETPYTSFNFALTSLRRVDLAGVRLDYQLSPQLRFMMRGNLYNRDIPYEGAGGATNHPASMFDNITRMKGVNTSLTQVLGSRAVNEVKAGWQSLYYDNVNYTEWAQHPAAPQGITRGSPRITFVGYSIAGNANQPQYLGQDLYSLRDDLSASFTARGRHDVKIGGEYLFADYRMLNTRNGMGVIDAQGGRPPANLEQLFPVWDDASTWNLNAISPLVRRYTVGIGNFLYNQKRHTAAAWVQDDWTLTPRLTLNLGVRWDSAFGVFANEAVLRPWLEADRPGEPVNLAPRLGFAYSLDDRTVVRGGAGLYFGEVLNNISSFTLSYANTVQIELENDGRPDFASNPFNGPFPTFEQAQRRMCPANPAPGCLRPFAMTIAPPPAWAAIPYSYQTSIGVQRQIGAQTAVEADYVYTGGRKERYGQGHNPQFNMNLTYDPATGINYRFNDITRRVDPNWGVVQWELFARRSNYHALQTSLTRRMSNRWQGSASYTLGALRDDDPMPLQGFDQVRFAVPADLGGEYSLAETDQRHRFVFNGLWDAGFGFQVSGLYFFGSGDRYPNYYGGDPRNTGRANSRLRPDATIVPRNSFVAEPIHRIDARVQRRFPLGSRAAISGIFEVFNLFNRENYGSYTVVESNRQYGLPVRSTNVAYQPRMIQLGFRATF
jgi:hypothetical protein